MLIENMPLKKMLDYVPDEEEMAMLDLDVVVYLKITLCIDLKIEETVLCK